MKAATIFLSILFTAHTSFAELRSIVVEMVAHQGQKPTVNIYSPCETDQRTNASIEDAAFVLHTTNQPFDTVQVFVLAEDPSISMEDLFGVLDGMKGNNWHVRLSYLRVGTFSEGDKRLLEGFKIPMYTKHSSP